MSEANAVEGPVGSAQKLVVSAHEACGQRAQSLRSVRSLHLVFHAVRQLFNLLRLLNHIDGQQAFVGLVHGLLQFVCQLEQFLGIALEISLALQWVSPPQSTRYPIQVIADAIDATTEVSRMSWFRT